MPDDAPRTRQDGHASENGSVHQVGHGHQVIGLTGRHAIGLVAAVLSLALLGMLAFFLMVDDDARPASVADATDAPRPAAGDGGVEVALSMHAEGGSHASTYLPSAAEERRHFSELGAQWGTAEYRAFARKQHLVHVGGNAVKLSVTNAGHRRIRVVDIRPVRIRREDPIDEVVYEPCCGAGGEEGVIADLDLDASRPRLIVDGSEYFQGHSVPIAPGDSFDIFVNYSSKKHYASFLLQVSYLDAEGELRSLLTSDTDPVTKSKRRFEVTAPPPGGPSAYQRLYRPVQLEPDPASGAARFRYQRITP